MAFLLEMVERIETGKEVEVSEEVGEDGEEEEEDEDLRIMSTLHLILLQC